MIEEGHPEYSCEPCVKDALAERDRRIEELEGERDRYETLLRVIHDVHVAQGYCVWAQEIEAAVLAGGPVTDAWYLSVTENSAALAPPTTEGEE